MKIIYENEQTFEENSKNLTILEISLKNGIKHIHVCDKQARCSSCLVAVLEGMENLSPKTEDEIALIAKKELPANIRLACQAKVNGDIKIRRLAIDDEDVDEIVGVSRSLTGREKPVAILFSDIRNFTAFSENHLSFDIIHALNRYYRNVGDAVLANNGYIDKYIGDGMMAIFGVENSPPEEFCLDAVRAALAMQKSLVPVNAYLKRWLNAEFEIGIGLHFGTAIIGQLGHPRKIQFTAIGDVVNMASRIESLTKKAHAKILSSESFYEMVKRHVVKKRIFKTEIKGKSGTHRVFELIGVSNAKDSRNTCSMQNNYSLKLLKKEALSPRVTGFWFDIQRLPFHFEPGQFIQLTLNLSGLDKTSDCRNFSITSTPMNHQSIMIATPITASPYKQALDALKAGDEVIVSKPLGKMKLNVSARPIVFIAGGMGINPIYSIIQAIVDEGLQRRFILFYACKNESTALYKDYLLKISKFLENSQVIFVYSQEKISNPPAYEAGRINLKLLQKYIPSLNDQEYYIAGPKTMVSELSSILKAQGIRDSQIMTEDIL